VSVAKLVFTPLSYTGWGALEHLLPEVSRFAPEKILVVTDALLEKIGIAQESLPVWKQVRRGTLPLTRL